MTNLMAELGKYNVIINFKFNESSETIQTIFTFSSTYRFKRILKLASDPSFSDGGISQFSWRL